MKQKNEQSDGISKADLKFFLNELRDELREEHRKHRDENMTRFDEVMGELQAMREDSEIGTYQIRNLTETTENHELRITKLEHA